MPAEVMEQRMGDATLRQRYLTLLERGNESPAECGELLEDLRRLILDHGLPAATADEEGRDFAQCTLRGWVWKALLGMPKLDSAWYEELLSRGPSQVYSKIRNDTFRTLKTDGRFQARVEESQLIRVLNAFAMACQWHPHLEHSRRMMNAMPRTVYGASPPRARAGSPSLLASTPPQADSVGTTAAAAAAAAAAGSATAAAGAAVDSQQRLLAPGGCSGVGGAGGTSASSSAFSSSAFSSSSLQFSYVQGMNVLLAPYLYVMPELDAFFCFSTLITTLCPLYVQPAMDGVHAGMRLFGQCLRVIDPELAEYLLSKQLPPTLYSFGSILTMCACTPPLQEVLKIWDFLLAFGVHLNVLCVLAQVVHMREQLMQSDSPMRLLRTFPPLQSDRILASVRRYVSMLPAGLYEELVRHTTEKR